MSFAEITHGTVRTDSVILHSASSCWALKIVTLKRALAISRPASGIDQQVGKLEISSMKKLQGRGTIRRISIGDTAQDRLSSVKRASLIPQPVTHVLGQLLCQLCEDVYTNPVLTTCGHTFCAVCLEDFVSHNRKCPRCDVNLEPGTSRPNHAITQLLPTPETYSEEMREPSGSTCKKEGLLHMISECSNGDIESMMSHLMRKKKDLELKTNLQACLAIGFVSEIRRRKMAEKERIENDLKEVEKDLNDLQGLSFLDSKKISLQSRLEETSAQSKQQEDQIQVHRFWKENFQDLNNIYRKIRSNEVNHSEFLKENSLRSNLLEFGELLDQVSRPREIKKIGGLKYCGDLGLSSQLICTIDFDRESEFFAIGGAANKVKLYEYGSVVSNPIGSGCPVSEFISRGTVSCVKWSPYFKSTLFGTEYSGVVTVWDAASMTTKMSWKAHEQKCWSGAWSHGDPRILASASDDASVRVWSTEMRRPIGILKMRANMCTVEFSPVQTYTVAVGGADRNIYLFDLRQPSSPFNTLCGHSRTVSGIKFLTKETFMSSSVDNQLLLWNAGVSKPVQSLQGHKNVNNFIGLANDGDLIAAGSEDDRIYLYHKYIRKPLAYYEFQNVESVFSGPIPQTPRGFVSALAWKKDSSVILAGNSHGIVNVLQLD